MNKNDKDFLVWAVAAPVLLILNIVLIGFVGPNLVSTKDTATVLIGLAALLLLLWAQAIALIMYLRKGDKK